MKFSNVKIRTTSGDVVELQDCTISEDSYMHVIENNKRMIAVPNDKVVWISFIKYEAAQ